MTVNGQRGFTVIEMLAAMLLGLVALAAVYSLYVSGSRVATVQSQLSQTRQNLRVGLEIIVEDVQAAGGTGMPASIAVNATNSETGPDSISLFAPSLVCVPPNPQGIPIVTYNGAAANMFLYNNSTCAAMDGTVAIAVHPNGEDYRTIEITEVTTANDKINYSPGLSSMNSPGGLGADYTGGTLVLVTRASYSVDLTNPTLPALRQDLFDGNGPQSVANFIEDFQISLGYDRNNDGILAEVGVSADDDEWVFNVPGEDNGTESPLNLRAVRIVVVGRTKRPDFKYQGSRPAILDRGVGPNDAYRRIVKTTKAQIRNFSF